MTRAFSDLSKEPVKAVETAIAARWESMDILNRTIDAHADDENFVFFEEPVYLVDQPILLLQNIPCSYLHKARVSFSCLYKLILYPLKNL